MRRSRGEEQQEQSSERGYRHDAEKLFLSLGASQYPPDGGNVRGGDNDGTQHQRHKPGSPDAQPLGDPFPALLRYGCRRYKVREEHRLNPPGQLHQAALQDHLQPTGQTGVLLLDRPILQRPGDPGLLLECTDRPKGFKACTDTNQGKRGRCMVRLQIHLQNA